MAAAGVSAGGKLGGAAIAIVREQGESRRSRNFSRRSEHHPLQKETHNQRQPLRTPTKVLLWCLKSAASSVKVIVAGLSLK